MKYNPCVNFEEERSSTSLTGGEAPNKRDQQIDSSGNSSASAAVHTTVGYNEDLSRQPNNNHFPPSKKYFKVNLLRRIFKKVDSKDKKNRKGKASSEPSLGRDNTQQYNNSNDHTSLISNGQKQPQLPSSSQQQDPTHPSTSTTPKSQDLPTPLSKMLTDYETASEDGKRRTHSPHANGNDTDDEGFLSADSGDAPTERTGATLIPQKETAALRRNSGRRVEPKRRRERKKKNKGVMVNNVKGSVWKAKVVDDPKTNRAYKKVPMLEITKLPRGGVSVETQAVGRVQFGIPPETIKDSMGLGLGVPTVYIVPSDRFCREMGPALGVNLAEFEFPAYFNFFVLKRRCILIVDSEEAEQNIRRVFGETLLGPSQFRREHYPMTHEEEDFTPGFPKEAIPNFHKELLHFRIMPNGEELVIETLLKFMHFLSNSHMKEHGLLESLGKPPLPKEDKEDLGGEKSGGALEMQEQEIEVDLDTGVGMPSAAMKTKTLQEESDDEDNPNKEKVWSFADARYSSDVATVYPSEATPEQIKSRTIPRVEIFKISGGTEYIIHDIDANNNIIGKARFSGSVRVVEGMKIAGFETNHDTSKKKEGDEIAVLPKPSHVLPPSFHPPSFGVTILGNSHGFDRSGSTSGYVLWVNGRGIMIDPPPYSSATLEREGIRPRTIVGIILTHCHADHDAGAFQKVLTGSPVVVITTPTIYKSFIRKYAALSALSPALLRHSHRHKPAIIGTPLRFQGAAFHFTYTLHTIPCVGFRVVWRGRSMVFTGDHFNSPPAIKMLQEKGVLSKARADDLTNLPLQECDLLLHEAGAPPIHTPLEVLLKLPQEVKNRLYVVHTSALPKDCELRVAPTGTAGTIRLDQLKPDVTVGGDTKNGFAKSGSLRSLMIVDEDRELDYSQYNTIHERETEVFVRGRDGASMLNRESSAASLESGTELSSRGLPLAALRPTSSTDAWFTLNLLSSVPFLTSLSYATTMEVLETARVDAYCMNDIVVPAHRRRDLLCVVWEGTCMEREPGSSKVNAKTNDATKRDDRRLSTFDVDSHGSYEPVTEMELKSTKKRPVAVWHAGDWTGPRALQPEKRLSGESSTSKTHDIVAMSSEGVKVIKIEFSSLHSILKSGSPLYRKYLARKERKSSGSRASSMEMDIPEEDTLTHLTSAVENLNLIELIDTNSALRRFSAVQKRHLESLAEGPITFKPGERLWRAGATVDKAFIIVAGTAAFVPKRRNAGSVGLPSGNMKDNKETYDDDSSDEEDDIQEDHSLTSQEEEEIVEFTDFHHLSDQPRGESTDFSRLAKSLRRRADNETTSTQYNRRHSSSSEDKSRVDSRRNSSSSHDETIMTDDNTATFDSHDSMIEDPPNVGFIGGTNRRKRNSSRDRYTNKVLGRLYSRRAFTSGLVFSRGHFLGDVSKMVAGLLSDQYKGENNDNDDSSLEYGFGDRTEGKTDKGMVGSLGEFTIHEREGDQLVVHSSTLAAGPNGCAVIFFPKASLIPFLDEYPGLLLSLLGTQAVV